jgi:hypothetical protein
LLPIIEKIRDPQAENIEGIQTTAEAFHSSLVSGEVLRSLRTDLITERSLRSEARSAVSAALLAVYKEVHSFGTSQGMNLPSVEDVVALLEL